MWQIVFDWCLLVVTVWVDVSYYARGGIQRVDGPLIYEIYELDIVAETMVEGVRGAS